LKRDLFVNVETWLHEQELRASPFRDDGSHGGMDPEAARFIARRSHDPTLPRATNGHRLTPQLGIVALLDRRIERIHVDMNDLRSSFRAPALSAETSCPGFMFGYSALGKLRIGGREVIYRCSRCTTGAALVTPASFLEPINICAA
jgi:hypothetical protein